MQRPEWRERKRERRAVNHTSNYTKIQRSLPGLKQRTNMKLSATSVGKNACKGKSCGTLTRIRASKAADTSWLAEIHLKYTCFQRFGKGLAKSPTSLTLSSPSPWLRCASFTHAPSVGRLNPSLRIIHWRTAGESR